MRLGGEHQLISGVTTERDGGCPLMHMCPQGGQRAQRECAGCPDTEDGLPGLAVLHRGCATMVASWAHTG